MTNRLCAFLVLNTTQNRLQSCSNYSASPIPTSGLARGKGHTGTFSIAVKGAVNGIEYDGWDRSVTEADIVFRITSRVI